MEMSQMEKRTPHHFNGNYENHLCTREEKKKSNFNLIRDRKKSGFMFAMPSCV